MKSPGVKSGGVQVAKWGPNSLLGTVAKCPKHIQQKCVSSQSWSLEIRGQGVDRTGSCSPIVTPLCVCLCPRRIFS